MTVASIVSVDFWAVGRRQQPESVRRRRYHRVQELGVEPVDLLGDVAEVVRGSRIEQDGNIASGEREVRDGHARIGVHSRRGTGEVHGRRAHAHATLRAEDRDDLTLGRPALSAAVQPLHRGGEVGRGDRPDEILLDAGAHGAHEELRIGRRAGGDDADPA